MRKQTQLFRLTASVALTALLCNTAMPATAMAQSVPPGTPPAAQPDQTQGDPPERVGRVAGLSGTVSFHRTGDTQWSAANMNFPVSTGNAFWTEPGAQALLEISDSRMALSEQTEFDVTTLDASGLQAVAPQGETYLHLRDLAPNEAWSVQTPRGLIRMTAGGRYGIVVGSTDQPTLVTVLDGAAEIDGPGVALQVGANQTASISGTDTFRGSIGAAQRDAFLSARLAGERPPPVPAAPIPRQVVYMPGGADLASYGSWSQTPDDGQVWYPPVAADWVPYRHGHWAYVAPWGWTWLDDAPWGFAPFHYGRWLQISGRWAWTPGVQVAAGPPVYAPALVTFIGLGAGVALGAAIASGSIGWIPLGPREAYHPWYNASPAYIRQVNVSHVTNVTNITTVNNTTINNYVNRGAATSVPASVMTGSQPVQAAARAVTPQQFAAARPVVGQEPVRPGAATVGVTPAVARQLNLGAVPQARVVPGPVVRVQANVPPGTAPPRPPLASPHGEPAPGVRPGGSATATTEPLSVREPARPVEPTRPGQPTRPGEPARPGEPRPGEPTRIGEPARPTVASPQGAHPEVARPEIARPAAEPAARPVSGPKPPGAVPPQVGREVGAPERTPERPAVVTPQTVHEDHPRIVEPAIHAERPPPRPETPARPAPEPPRAEARSEAQAPRPAPVQRAEVARPAHPASPEHDRKPGEEH